MRIRINLWQQIKPFLPTRVCLGIKSVSLRLLTNYTLELILQLTDQATDSKYRIRIHTNPSLLSLGRRQINAGLSIYQCLWTMRQIIWPKSGPPYYVSSGWLQNLSCRMKKGQKWNPKFYLHQCVFQYLLLIAGINSVIYFNFIIFLKNKLGDLIVLVVKFWWGIEKFWYIFGFSQVVTIR